MLVNMNDILAPAKAGKYGVGFFNAVNVEMARAFISKTKFIENISTNEDARYLFYMGKIEAIQMNYSDAFSHLTNSYRKSPEKCGEGFKNTVNKLIIIVQLLMGEIPDIKSLMKSNQITDYTEFKPYLLMLKMQIKRIKETLRACLCMRKQSKQMFLLVK